MSDGDDDEVGHDIGSGHEDIGRLSANLLSQESDIQELRDELKLVNDAFEAFKKDYSQLLTLYNGTNDQLQELLCQRNIQGSGPTADDLVTLGEQLNLAQVERDKYKEMYIEKTRHVEAPPPPVVHTNKLDTAELHDQIRDLVDQVQELELVREELGLRVQQQAAEKDELIDQMRHVKVACEELETEHQQLQHNVDMSQETVNIKNVIIDKLRAEFTELGDENTRLRADISKFVHSKDSQERLLDSANLNQDDLTKDYQALQYRCSETERREQEALLYIKDCLKLVEQSQHEKEQLVIQAAQSENMRCEIEYTLGSIVEEASRRTQEEVEKIKKESNKIISQLIHDSGMHQELVAELEAKIEEMEREQELAKISGGRSDEIQMADKDAVIYKLREHVEKLAQDKINLTDQLLEVSNMMRMSKEHFDSKVLSLSSQLSASKDKISRLTQDNKSLYEETNTKCAEFDALRNSEKAFRGKMNEMSAVLAVTQKEGERQLADLREEEGEKREQLKRTHEKLVSNMRSTMLDRQNEMNQVKEASSQLQFTINNRESELINTIANLTKKSKATSTLYKQAMSDLEKVREQYQRQCDKRYKSETRLKAVNMQLASAGSQIEIITENEAKLCTKQKELQIKIDELEFELQRSNVSSRLNQSNFGNLAIHLPTMKPTKDKSSSKKRERMEKKEKKEISRIFSGQIRAKSGLRASTPYTDKSDVTIKFTDHVIDDDDVIGGIENDR